MQNYPQGLPQLTEEQEYAQIDISRYNNYLTQYDHKPLLRSQFKDYFHQRDYFKKQEQADVEKLGLALAYLKEIFHSKSEELTTVEHTIKKRAD